MAARTHKDLIVWRQSVVLASRIYELTARFPSYDRQTLSTQMRRCAVSVASNIAEGAARASRAEYIRFLDIARGSLAELETQIQICVNLQILDQGAQLEELTAEVGRLLTALIRRLREHRERARGFESPPRPPTSH
jgi:four helix bundle protein